MKVAYSTTGHASPATVALDAKPAGISYGYLYQGDPSKTPGHPGYVPEASRGDRPPTPATDAHRQRRLDRMARFAEHYAELRPELGKRPAILEAGRRVGVGEATAYEYERHVRSEQS